MSQEMCAFPDLKPVTGYGMGCRCGHCVDGYREYARRYRERRRSRRKRWDRLGSPAEWLGEAACRGLAWWPWPEEAEREVVERAIEVCERCPVVAECKQYADDTGQVGVWGAKARGFNQRESISSEFDSSEFNSSEFKRSDFVKTFDNGARVRLIGQERVGTVVGTKFKKSGEATLVRFDDDPDRLSMRRSVVLELVVEPCS